MLCFHIKRFLLLIIRKFLFLSSNLLLISGQFGKHFVYSICIYGDNLSTSILIVFAKWFHGTGHSLQNIYRVYVCEKHVKKKITLRVSSGVGGLP